MEKQYFPNIKETLYHEVLPNGLNVFMLPKADYCSVCGIIATKFGSLQSDAIIETPAGSVKARKGIAHFLEHRSFDYKQGPVLDLFAALEADSNAFTSYDKTAYYFNTTSNVEQCANLLLDFIYELNITPASVEKEKGIIVEELKMYADRPMVKLIRGILEGLYVNHQIRDDIGGTIETVNATTLQELAACHQTFYHPSNMVLIFAGNIQPEQLIEVVKQNQKQKAYGKRHVFTFPLLVEPEEVNYAYSEIALPLSIQKVAVGYKLKAYAGKCSAAQANKLSMVNSIYLDLLFGGSSSLYASLYKQGIISPSLEAAQYEGDDYRSVIIVAEVLDYPAFIQAVKQAIANPDLPQESFERLKNSMLGQSIRGYEDIQSLAFNFMDNYFRGVNALEDYEVLKSIKYEDVLQVSEEYKVAPSSIFTIIPTGGKQND